MDETKLLEQVEFYRNMLELALSSFSDAKVSKNRALKAYVEAESALDFANVAVDSAHSVYLEVRTYCDAEIAKLQERIDSLADPENSGKL